MVQHLRVFICVEQIQSATSSHGASLEQCRATIQIYRGRRIEILLFHFLRIRIMVCNYNYPFCIITLNL